jgi:Zn-dependent peptidase ImmA (M78 family)/transcriptional regulator with XRE-family HTH domain
MLRIEVQPQLLRWARERAGLDPRALAPRFPRLGAWERGEAQPTLKQLERFAKAVHAPVGFLFLPEPPVERLPIPDFRTPGNARIERPSPDLLETIYICQQRQDWYRDYAQSEREEPRPFVGAASLSSDPVEVGAAIRGALGFDLEERRRLPNWTEALRRFIGLADEIGILVMVSGVVGSNNRRKLDPNEFRGFALSDSLAPLVFINGADTRAAQNFTLAHEIAHIWLGASGVSDVEPAAVPNNAVETWCNRVAAEILVPLALFREEYRRSADLAGEINRLASRFRVSTLVILRRLRDAGALSEQDFWREYRKELARLLAIPRGDGGNFYLTLGARASQRFARALVVSTLEGQTLYRDALHLLGFSKLSTFHELGHSLGVS